MDVANASALSVELNYLCLSVFLGLAMLIAATIAGTVQRGFSWNVGPRDQPLPVLTGKAGRFDRALQNFKETFPFFVAAVFLVQASGRHSSLTALGAALYFYGRLIYVPLYYFGIPYIRTLVWTTATVGIVLLMVAH